MEELRYKIGRLEIKMPGETEHVAFEGTFDLLARIFVSYLTANGSDILTIEKIEEQEDALFFHHYEAYDEFSRRKRLDLMHERMVGELNANLNFLTLKGSIRKRTKVSKKEVRALRNQASHGDLQAVRELFLLNIANVIEDSVTIAKGSLRYLSRESNRVWPYTMSDWQKRNKVRK